MTRQERELRVMTGGGDGGYQDVAREMGVGRYRRSQAHLTQVDGGLYWWLAQARRWYCASGGGGGRALSGLLSGHS